MIKATPEEVAEIAMANSTDDSGEARVDAAFADMDGGLALMKQSALWIQDTALSGFCEGLTKVLEAQAVVLRDMEAELDELALGDVTPPVAQVPEPAPAPPVAPEAPAVESPQVVGYIPEVATSGDFVEQPQMPSRPQQFAVQMQPPAPAPQAPPVVRMPPLQELAAEMPPS